MTTKQKPYGYIYDKQGNKREIFAPTTSTGKPVKPHKTTKTGGLLGGVGFSMGKQS